jgi:anti-sigma factor RsiW
MSQRWDHAAIDELGAAAVLGALEPDELAAVREHLASCPEPHDEVRALVGVDQVLAMSLEPESPSPQLRDRLMASIESAPQEHARAGAEPVEPAREAEAVPSVRRGWLDWLSPQVARPLALAAMVAVIAVGGWALALQGQLADRDRALRSVADAIAVGDVAFRVQGPAGRGYVVDTPGPGGALVVADVSSLEPNQLYELWLIGAEGPVAVGIFRPTGEELAVVHVERDLTGYDVFAVTVEASRVEAPTGDPVMKAPLTPPGA